MHSCWYYSIDSGSPNSLSALITILGSSLVDLVYGTNLGLSLNHAVYLFTLLCSFSMNLVAVDGIQFSETQQDTNSWNLSHSRWRLTR